MSKQAKRAEKPKTCKRCGHVVTDDLSLLGQWCRCGDRLKDYLFWLEFLFDGVVARQRRTAGG